MKLKIAILVSVALACSIAVWAYTTPQQQTLDSEMAVANRKKKPEPQTVAKSDIEQALVLNPSLQRWLASKMDFQPRPHEIETSGFNLLINLTKPWSPDATLSEIAFEFEAPGQRLRQQMERFLQTNRATPPQIVETLILKAATFQMEGHPEQAYSVLSETRALVEGHPMGARDFLFSVIYLQGVAALRMGENANCVMCRGESSCILPIDEAAVHKNREGSLRAINHFAEYLSAFPDDLKVKWLFNLAFMTLGEYPDKVPSKHLIDLESFLSNKHSIGHFEEVGARLAINRFNQAGGAIMDDFDNDGLLDIVFSSYDARVPLAVYKNIGTGKFENVSRPAGVESQLGGLNCVQTDFNNDGLLDILVLRGAWYRKELSIRPSLLKNTGDLKFEDVTESAGLAIPLNSIAAQWADYDNDGWLDVLIACEAQRNHLFRNLKDGTFEECAVQAGLSGEEDFLAKGVAWIDYNNDGYQDVFINNLSKTGGQFYVNNHDGTFTKKSIELGVQGPESGFSCWSFDYDNDGYLDILATCYQNNLAACVHGLLGLKQPLATTKLYRNVDGQKFEDKSTAANLDLVLYCMGSNYGDFDGDGYLDFYLGTGEPDISSLVPNRMFRNIGGEKFADISASSGTAHLQKGHGVSCGDWDNDGDIDLLVEMGGAIDGDRFHNLMFQNSADDKAFIKLKLQGVDSNRAAIGTRIKVVTDNADCPEVHRTVSSGSSFGANPLTNTIGLGDASKIKFVEITWPKSGLVQTFNEVKLNSYFEISEFDTVLHGTRQEPLHLPPEVTMQEAMKSSKPF